MGGKYAVPFETTAPGHRSVTGVAELTPGGAITLTRKLEAE
jgi:hypothetical protein